MDENNGNSWTNGFGDRDQGENGGGNFRESRGNNGNENAGMSIASLVFGILSVVCCCTGWFSLVFAALALVFGIISVRNGKGGRELAIAGMITGGCGLVLAVVMLIFAALAAGISGNFLKDSIRYYDLEELYDLYDMI